MPAGLQCWDEYGRIILDTADRICRVVGYYDFPGGTSGFRPGGIIQQIAVNMDPNAVPFYHIIANDSSSPVPPSVSFQDNNATMNISISYTGNGQPAYSPIACRIIFGVY